MPLNRRMSATLFKIGSKAPEKLECRPGIGRRELECQLFSLFNLKTFCTLKIHLKWRKDDFSEFLEDQLLNFWPQPIKKFYPDRFLGMQPFIISEKDFFRCFTKFPLFPHPWKNYSFADLIKAAKKWPSSGFPCKIRLSNRLLSQSRYFPGLPPLFQINSTAHRLASHSHSRRRLIIQIPMRISNGLLLCFSCIDMLSVTHE